jgi:hypothetical protein
MGSKERKAVTIITGMILALAFPGSPGWLRERSPGGKMLKNPER